MLKRTRKNMFALLCCFLCAFLLLGCEQEQPEPETDKSNTVPEYEGTIIAVGDSLTAGLGVPENKAWPALLETKLQNNGKHWQVINAGISGETSSGTLSRIQWILAQKPDVVILETGANDGFRGIPPALIRKNIAKSVQILQEGNVTVLLAGMQIVQNLGAEYTKAFADIYPSVARERGCLLIPFLLENVAGKSALNQADTIHPNEKGHVIVAETVYPFVLQALQDH